ncbi:MAG: hypothetical protein ACLFWL_09320 [Candidatus Brocadiia bacterium]
MNSLRRFPVNEAESVVLPLWFDQDPSLEPTDIWLNEEADTARTNDWVTRIQWARPTQGPVARLSWEGELNLVDDDRISTFAAPEVPVHLIVRTTVDGEMTAPIELDLDGTEMDTYEGEISGERLEKIEIEVESSRQQAGSCGFLYVKLVSTAGRRRMSEKYTFTSDWPGKLIEPDEIKPALGLFFDGDDLDDLRAKAESRVYAPLMFLLRERAHEYMRKHPDPEDAIGYFAVKHPDKAAMAETSRQHRWTPVVAARLCGMVGLIDEDTDVLRYAARCLLSLVSMRTWRNNPRNVIPDLPLVGMDPPPKGYIRTIVRAWDWAGCMLSDTAHAMIRRRMWEEGISRLQSYGADNPWILQSNHGISHAASYMLAIMALKKQQECAGEFVERAESFLLDNFAGNVEPDGSAPDVPPNYTFNKLQLLYTLVPLMRERGQDLHDYARKHLPPGLFNSGNYLRQLMPSGEDVPLGAFLPIGDSGMDGACSAGGYPILNADAALIMGRVTDQKFWKTTFGDILRSTTQEREELPWTGKGRMGPAMMLVLGPDPDEMEMEEKPGPPVFSIPSVSGIATSSRPSEAGDVRLTLVGSRVSPGHSHEDKGSIIMEAAGEQLLVDPGMGPYEDPSCRGMKYAARHNLLLPMPTDGSEPHQTMPQSPLLPTGSGDETLLHWTLDTSPVWPDNVVRCVRRVTSEEAVVINLEDELRTREPAAAALNFISPLQWEETAEGVCVQGDNVGLHITPEWTPSEVEIRDADADWAGRSLRRVVLYAPESTEHDLETVLKVTIRS